MLKLYKHKSPIISCSWPTRGIFKKQLERGIVRIRNCICGTPVSQSLRQSQLFVGKIVQNDESLEKIVFLENSYFN